MLGFEAIGCLTPGEQPRRILAFPLTYDEEETFGQVTLTRYGGNGPHITPEGTRCNAYSHRYYTTAAPAWVEATAATARRTIHASIRLSEPGGGFGTNSPTRIFGDHNRTEFTGIPDAWDSGIQNVASWVETTTGDLTISHGRGTWYYRGRYPELSFNSQAARPQAIGFLDGNTVLLTAHASDTLSRAYTLNASSWELLDQFDFTSGYNHVASCAKDSGGNYWFGDYTTGKLLKVNLANSFSSGTSDIALWYDLSALTGFGAIAWVTVSGTEYLLAAEYATSGTTYLYLIPATTITASGTFALGDRYKRFVIPNSTQGVTVREDKLYLACSDAVGTVYRYDGIEAFVSGQADGATLTATLSRHAPARYCEDIAFHPDTGELWGPTEGRTAVGDDDGHLGVWSSDLSGANIESHYTCEYDAGAVTTWVNQRLFAAATKVSSYTFSAVNIGGWTTTSGTQYRFHSGTIRNAVIADGHLPPEDIANIIAGCYEPYVLDEYVCPVSNPGAETGDTTGWTNEVGGLAAKTNGVHPALGGAYYFYGGDNAQTIARQRFDLTAVTGMSGAQLDAASPAMWATTVYDQASFASSNDPGCGGLRFLDGTLTELSAGYAALHVVAPVTTWGRKSFATLVPSGARYVDVLLRGDRSTGTSNDAYFDNVSLRVFHQNQTPRPQGEQVTYTRSASLGALLMKIASLGADAGAVLSLPESNRTASAGSVLGALYNRIADLGAVLARGYIPSGYADAAIRRNDMTRTAALGSAVQKRRAGTSDAGSVLGQIYTRVTGVSGMELGLALSKWAHCDFQLNGREFIPANALLTQARSGAATGDAYLSLAGLTKTATLDAIFSQLTRCYLGGLVQGTVAATTSGNAILAGIGTKTTTIDFKWVVETARLGYADACLQHRYAPAVSANAYYAWARSRTTRIGAVLGLGYNRTLSANAALQHPYAVSSGINAALSKTGNKTANANSAVSRAGQAKTLAAGAYLRTATAGTPTVADAEWVVPARATEWNPDERGTAWEPDARLTEWLLTDEENRWPRP